MMLLGKTQFEELKYLFAISNTTKYFFDMYFESDIINSNVDKYSIAEILEEVRVESDLNAFDSLVYLYYLLFLLYKKQSSEYQNIITLMIENNLPRAEEILSIMDSNLISINYSIIKYCPVISQYQGEY